MSAFLGPGDFLDINFFRQTLADGDADAADPANESSAVGDLPDACVFAKTHFAKALMGIVVGVETGNADGLAAACFIEGSFLVAIHSQKLVHLYRFF
jgi:hypothetical protein